MIEETIYITGFAPKEYPIGPIFALLNCKNDNPYEMPRCLVLENGWCNITSTYISERTTYSIPNSLDLLWIALVEKKVYSIESELNNELLNTIVSNLRERDNSSLLISIGFAPKGQIYLWIQNKLKSIIIFHGQAETVMKENDKFSFYSEEISVDDYCKKQIGNSKDTPNNYLIFDKYMQQFTYRYLPLFEKWDKDEEKWMKYEKDEERIPEFEYIEEALYDGTHDKLHDDGLLKYHEAGKPKKLAVKWHIKKSEYTAYFWLDETLICEIFEKFYGAHRDTKSDFIIRIDAEQKRYELALYRYGLKEAVIIPEGAYQLLVFKNKFEHYRSENYNQERGAWIW